jgi:membrane protein insertase Oxa1/YidC/SpoIIIJ
MQRVRPVVAPLLRTSFRTRPAYNHGFAVHGKPLRLPIASRQFSIFGWNVTGSQKTPVSSAPASLPQAPELPDPTPSSLEEFLSASASSPPTLPEADISLLETALSPVVTSVAYIFSSFHDYSHLSWPASILAVTFILRLSVQLLLANHGTRQGTRLTRTFEPMRVAISHYVFNPQRSSVARPSRDTIQRLALTVMDRINTHYKPETANVAGWRVRLATIPIWITVSEALRAIIGCQPGLIGLLFGGLTTFDPKIRSAETLSALHRPEMATEASWLLPWISDLTVADPLYILPVTFGGLIWYSMHSTWKVLKVVKPGEIRGPFDPWILLLAVAIGTVSTKVPAALVFYWAASSGYGVFADRLIAKFRNRRGAKDTADKGKLILPRRSLVLSKKQTLFLGDDMVTKR